MPRHKKASLIRQTISATFFIAIKLKSNVDITYSTVLAGKKSEGAHTGSEGLGIRPSKGEVSTPATRKSTISPVALGEVAALAPSSDVMSLEALG